MNSEQRWLKHRISALCTQTMAGRGYVNNGRERAAKYVAKVFAETGLKPVTADSSYYQVYHFPVNTFPDRVTVKINKKELVPGVDFLVDAASESFTGNKLKIKRIDLNDVKDSAAWTATKASFMPNKKVYMLQHADSFCKRMSLRLWHFASELPRGCYILPQHGKLTWTVATDTTPATVFYVEDTVLPKRSRKATIDVHAVFKPNEESKNIIGEVPGEVADSFIVFTAHYDHLGMMGKEATFDGASDNASGTAMLMYLANYFIAHPQHYSILFIAFSGEEAGLLGSHYFTEHPLIPLDHIRFLTNLDIMGDATDGVTVVNATEYPKEFSLLQHINDIKGFLPAVKSRGKAANSDHYYFTEAGVPSFFIYSNGGKGYYHDVFDTPQTLSLKNIDKVADMLIDFTVALQKPGK